MCLLKDKVQGISVSFGYHNGLNFAYNSTKWFRKLHYKLDGPQLNKNFKRAVKRNDIQTVLGVLNGPVAKNLDTMTLIKSVIVARRRGYHRMSRIIESYSDYRSTRNITKFWYSIVRWFKRLRKRVKHMF
jgi:hypothetical protein